MYKNGPELNCMRANDERVCWFRVPKGPPTYLHRRNARSRELTRWQINSKARPRSMVMGRKPAGDCGKKPLRETESRSPHRKPSSYLNCRLGKFMS